MSKVQKLLKNWPLHLAMLAIVVVFEGINTISIKTPVGGISLLPMLFAMVAGLILFLIKPLTFVKEEQSHLSGDFVMIGIGFLLAKVAVNTGIQLDEGRPCPDSPGAGQPGHHRSGAAPGPAAGLRP